MGQLVLASALAATAACAPSGRVERTATGELAIVGASADAERDGVVGLMLGSELDCSGVLVSPRVVLTAAHCLDGFPPDGVFEGVSLAAGGALLPVSDVAVHPGYDRATYAKDVAVVVLGIPASSPARRFRTSPLDATLAGATVLVEGFGASAATGGGAGIKRSGTARVLEIGAGFLRVEAAPALPCAGDSGGPVFASANAGADILGIASSGDGSCATTVIATRADSIADFVASWVTASQDSSTPPGARCVQPDNCRVGTCYLPPDAAAFAYCSPTCLADGACPSGMACDGTRCVWPTPAPGALSAPCRDSSECARTLCGRPRLDESRVCASLCFADAPICPDGYVCEPDVEQGHTYACFRSAPIGTTAAAPEASTGEGASSAPRATGGDCALTTGPSRGAGAASAMWITAAGWAARGARRRRRGCVTLLPGASDPLDGDVRGCDDLP